MPDLITWYTTVQFANLGAGIIYWQTFWDVRDFNGADLTELNI